MPSRQLAETTEPRNSSPSVHSLSDALGAWFLARRLIDATPGSAGTRSGCRILRFLATDEAAAEMIRRYGSAQGCGA